MSGRVRKPVDLDFFESLPQKKKKPKVPRNKRQPVSERPTVHKAAPPTETPWVPPSVVLSQRDKAQLIEVSNDQLVCIGQDVSMKIFGDTNCSCFRHCCNLSPVTVLYLMP